MHCHGGYLVGIHETMLKVFGVQADHRKAYPDRLCGPPESEVMLVLATPAWITGQSYMISGSLLCGITSVLIDGSPVAPRTTRFAEVIARNKVCGHD